MRLWRKENPIKSAYINLKSNAKKRKKSFELSYQEFTEFCRNTEYIYGKGRNRTNLHIDRNDETKGYTKDNIRCIPNYKNVIKYLDWKYDYFERKMKFTTKQIITNKNEQNNNWPF